MDYKSDMATQIIQLLGGLIVMGLFSCLLALMAFIVSFVVSGWL